MTTPTPENNPRTILTLSARPEVDRRTCRPTDYPPYEPVLSVYRDCKGFGRYLR